MPEITIPDTPAMRLSRPLAGVTLLLVEDSRLCSEAFRLITLRAGARLRRADSIAAAHRHMKIYCPDVLVVDIGLPDGSGLDLIAQVTSQRTDRPCVIATSGADDGAVEAASKSAGADAFLAKPMVGPARVVDLIEQLLNMTSHNKLRLPPALEKLDSQAMIDDLDRVEAILSDALPKMDSDQLKYCAQFVQSVATTAEDAALIELATRFLSVIDGQSAVPNDASGFLNQIKARVEELCAQPNSRVA
ncbi:MAG: response regulator [Pseudomonadota bacterium]